jgi:hypothetical protein
MAINPLISIYAAKVNGRNSGLQFYGPFCSVGPVHRQTSLYTAQTLACVVAINYKNSLPVFTVVILRLCSDDLCALATRMQSHA